MSNGVWMITGAAGALGSALARLLAADDTGLVLLDRNRRGLERLADELEADVGRQPALVPLDLAGASPQDYQSLAESLESNLGRLDVLVHAAADFSALRPVEHTEPLDWFKGMQAGVTGPVLLTQAMLPLLRHGDSGKVVFILDSPEQRARPFWGAYGVCQSARQALVGIMAGEAGPGGPAVMGFDPGAFRSPLRAAAWPGEAPDRLPSPEDAARHLIDAVRGHLHEPGD